MITAGQLIELESLHRNFGSSRVRETGRRLREAGIFPKGQSAVEVKDVAIFLYVLSATSHSHQVISAILLVRALKPTMLQLLESILARPVGFPIMEPIKIVKSNTINPSEVEHETILHPKVLDKIICEINNQQ